MSIMKIPDILHFLDDKLSKGWGTIAEVGMSRRGVHEKMESNYKTFYKMQLLSGIKSQELTAKHFESIHIPLLNLSRFPLSEIDL